MANEITIQASLRVANGNLVDAFTPGSLLVNQASALRGGYVQTIPTTAGGTALNFGDVTTAGYAAFRNLDATNYIDLGPDNAGAILAGIRLQPGDILIGRLKPGVTWRALAHTASVNLQVLVLND